MMHDEIKQDYGFPNDQLDRDMSGMDMPGDIYFRRLGDAMTKALVDSERWKRETEPKALQVSAYESFLSCGVSHMNVNEMTYNAPVACLYMLCLYGFIRSEYTDMTDRAGGMIREKLSKLGLMFERDAEWSLRQNMMMMIGSSEYREMPAFGSVFIQDGEGCRMVVAFKMKRGYTVNGEVFGVRVIGDRRNGAEEKSSRFFHRFEQFTRQNHPLRKGVFNVRGRYVDLPPTGWDELRIPPALRREIDFHIVDFMNNLDRIEAGGLPTSRGIVLCGKPGTGKTLLGRVLASNLACPMIWVTARDMTGTDTMDGIFTFAEYCAPVVLFIEDADIFLGDRAGNHNSGMLSEFLNRIDGLRKYRGILTLITANNPERLDEAVKNRPGRFDACLEIPLPSLESRRLILEDRLGGHVDVAHRELLDKAAGALDGFSGAHVAEFSNRVRMNALYGGGPVSAEAICRELELFGSAGVKRPRPGFLPADTLI